MENNNAFIILSAMGGYFGFVLIYLFGLITRVEIFLFVIKGSTVLIAGIGILKANKFIYIFISFLAILLFFLFIHSFIHETHHTLISKIFGVEVLFIKAGYIRGDTYFDFSTLNNPQISLIILR